MLVMQGVTSIAATTTTENVLSGQRYERAPFNGVGRLYLTAGGTIGQVNTELNVGGRSITPPTPASIQNRVPLVPDDSVVEDWEFATGELIQLRVQNTSGGALNCLWRIELEEYAE